MSPQRASPLFFLLGVPFRLVILVSGFSDVNLLVNS